MHAKGKKCISNRKTMHATHVITSYHILSVFLLVERDGDGKIDENGGGGGGGRKHVDKTEVEKWLNKEEKERFYLTTHSTHFIDGYMASGIW